MTAIHSLPPILLGEELSRSAADLWCFYYEEFMYPGLVAAYGALLSEEERTRQKGFRFESDRQMFLATRALVRTVLSNYADIPPADWRFAEKRCGKPYVAGPARAPAIEFNLTNTRGLVACVVSGCRNIGVDAERITRQQGMTLVAERSFSAIELRTLRSLPLPARHDRFFHYWTLKESYLKARGAGLALPLNQLSFLIDGGAVRVLFDSSIADDSRNWRFASLRGSSAHVIAVAAKTHGLPLCLRSASYVPLHGIFPFDSRR